MQVQIQETGEIRDVSISQVTKSNYICPKGEEGFIHCKMEIKNYKFDENHDPVKISKPFIQKFEPRWFNSVGLHELRQQGYSIDILFDPEEYKKFVAEQEREAAAALAEEEKQKAEREAEEAKKKAEEEEKKRQEDKAKMRAEIMAELKEEGIIPSEDKKPSKKSEKDVNNESTK